MGELRRTLGVTDAVVVGAGSMIGAGVFVAWSPAARAAGSGLLIGLAVAAVVASCNATSSASLAAQYPESGGTYVYARERLGPGWGHLAGWGFVVGKTASCAAMALAIGAYVWPEQERWVACAAIALVTVVNVGGLSRTVLVTKVLLVVSTGALAVVVASGLGADATDASRLRPDIGGVDGVHGVLQASGFLFFAFAGYARIATLGEEVRDPARTIPRAIPLALGVVLVVYALVGIIALATVGPDVLGASAAPLREVTEAGWLPELSPIVRVGAAVASLGVLLNLVPGISRTVLAMARRRELPTVLSAVSPTRALPLRAEATVAIVAIAVVVALDLRSAIGVSGVAVLTYYAITNASALTLADGRRSQRWMAALGLVGCVVLVAALPWRAVLTGLVTLGIGVLVRTLSGPGRLGS